MLSINVSVLLVIRVCAVTCMLGWPMGETSYKLNSYETPLCVASVTEKMSTRAIATAHISGPR